MKYKNILVTGGAGFIGSNLIEHLLKKGMQVICLDNLDPYYSIEVKKKNIEIASKSPEYTFLKADILDSKALANCFEKNHIDIVVHLAAKAGVRPSLMDPKGYYDVNVSGTLNLLETMKTFGVKKMVFASSSSVYGNNTKIPFSETDIVDFPISPYAATKKAGELLCHTYHHLYDFDIFCLRFFTVYGPRQRPDLAIYKFTKAILNGEPIPFYGDGSNKRDYTHITDIINGIEGTLDNLSGFEILNLGESTPISLSELVQYLEEFTGGKAQLNKLPLQQGDVNITYADIEKAINLIGYSPKMDIQEGLKGFVHWYKKQIF
jgi:UDP-glucuronate 4-epimerase